MDSATSVWAGLGVSRRTAVAALISSATVRSQSQSPQEQAPQQTGPPRDALPPAESQDRRLPNGKSQADAIAKADHQRALEDAENLVAMAEQLRDELKR